MTEDEVILFTCLICFALADGCICGLLTQKAKKTFAKALLMAAITALFLPLLFLYMWDLLETLYAGRSPLWQAFVHPAVSVLFLGPGLFAICVPIALAAAFVSYKLCQRMN